MGRGQRQVIGENDMSLSGRQTSSNDTTFDGN